MKKEYQKGFSLFLTILLISVVLSVVLGLSAILIRQYKTMRAVGNSVNIFYAAETGAEKTLYDIFKTGEISHTYEEELDNGTEYLIYLYCCNPENINCQWEEDDCPIIEEGERKYHEDCDAKRFCLYSTGISNRARRTIEIKVDKWVQPGGFYACGNSFTDTRDGNIYNTVLIGDQCWMKENLNVGTMITSCSNGYLGTCTNNGETAQSQGTSCVNIKKYCYGDNQLNCSTYGGLYQWNQAMCGASSCNGSGASPNDACSTPIKGICPDGWHLPSHYEITTLEREICTSETCSSDFLYDTTTQGSWRGTTEGDILKKTGLCEGRTPCGTSGFDLLMSGHRWDTGEFYSFSSGTFFWSSTEFSLSTSNVLSRHFGLTSSMIYRGAHGKPYGFSIRCIKD